MDERQAYRQGHPPACTCVDCSQKRLRRTQRVSLWQRVLDLFKRRR